MKALFWIALCAAVYFILYILDKEGEKMKEEKKPAPTPRPIANTNASVQELKFFCIKDKGYHVSVWPNVDGYANIDYIEFNIAGISHYAKTAMKHLGESLAILSPEPDNPYDQNAIRVMTSDWQLLGYVPRDMTDIIHEHTSGSTCPCFIYIGYREDDDVFYTDAYINLNLIKK